MVVDAQGVIGSGTTERDTAIAQVGALPPGRKTMGGDKGFDRRPFVEVSVERHRGVDRVNWVFLFSAAAYSLVRMRNLTGRAA